MAAITAQQIRQYLQKKGSPLAAYANDFINVGNKYGIDPRFLVAISGAETGFAKAGSRLANPFGYMSAKRFSGPREVLERMATDLTRKTGGYYSGKNTISSIGATWAPVGASNDPNGGNGGWPAAVSQFYREMGGNPNSPVKGGGVATGVASSNGITGSTQSGMDYSRLLAMSRQQAQNIQSGTGYDQALASKLKSTILASIGNGGGTAGKVLGAAAPGGGGYLATAQDVGLGTGGVDSHLVTPGGAGGNWGGSMPRALAMLRAAKNAGYVPNTGGHWLSQKRSRQMTASGNPSDHWEGSSQSYAIDLGMPNLQQGDSYLKSVMSYLGQPGYKGGSWLNINKGGYRYQVGWRVPGHYDHIHVGVRKV